MLVPENLDLQLADKKVWIWLHFYNSDMLGLTALTCSYLDFSQSAFTGIKLVEVVPTSQVVVKVASLGTSWS
jgi:hypothetical protein